ncbi:MAG TPA: hypothetical protein V6D11_32465 [Waterburya sp.]|jgi:hypothetical protein
MTVPKAIASKWFHEHREFTAETIVDIVKALQGINSTAAKKFIRLYLGEFLEDPD